MLAGGGGQIIYSASPAITAEAIEVRRRRHRRWCEDGQRHRASPWVSCVRLTQQRLDKAEAFFNRHGAWIITIARFIEVLRQANGIVAGTSGMRWRRFLAFNALGAALWVGTWVSLGYLAGSHIAAIYHNITRYSSCLLIALAVVLAGYLARHIRRRTRRRTAPAKANQAQDEPKATARNRR